MTANNEEEQMKNRFRFKSIQTDMVICFVSLVLLVIGIYVSFSLVYTKENLKRNFSENNQDLIDQVGITVENYMCNMNNVLESITQQGDVTEYLKTQQSDEQLYSQVQNILGAVVSARSDIYDIAVVGEEGCSFMIPEKALNPYARLGEKRWYREAQKSERDLALFSHVQNIVAGEYKWVITLSRRLEDSFGRPSGKLLIVDMNYEVIHNLCEEVNMGENGYVYILDENGEIIYHPQQQLILGGVKNELLQEVIEQESPIFYTDEAGNEKLYTSCRSQKTGWTIVGVSYMSEIIEDAETFNKIYISLAVILIVLALAVAVFLSKRITKPIKSLQNVMQNMHKGKFEPVYMPIEGENEITSLYYSYNRMIAFIGELLEMNMQKAKEQQQSEMQALQAQINPHFLYNTLDSIIWMIETDDQEQAIRMTSALARFFQRAIGKPEVFVTIKEELEYTKQYLVIQRMRYKDKIDFDIQVNSDILEEKIIKLVLQPLVENALYHGLKYKKGKGLIRISGYRMGDDIWMKVSDNGIGMDADKISSLLKAEDKDRGNAAKGVGLANVHDRIQLYYGEEYGLTVESEKGIGTTVTVVISAKRGASGQAEEL